MLVTIKEISTKMHFHGPPKILAPFYTTSTQHTDFLYWPKFSPSKVSRQ